MFGLPADIDLSFWRNLALFQVCLGENEVILHFDESVSLTIEGAFQIETPFGRSGLFTDAPMAAGALAALLHSKTTGAARTAGGALKVSFSSGTHLEVYDSSEHQESYQIRHGVTLYVV